MLHTVTFTPGMTGKRRRDWLSTEIGKIYTEFEWFMCIELKFKWTEQNYIRN